MSSLNAQLKTRRERESASLKTQPVTSAGVRTCTLCARAFAPSSNHKLCPAYRQKVRRDRCMCGTLKTRRAKTCLRCRAEAGASNGNWRGGTVKHRAGYVLRRVPSHPKAKTANGYILEHVLVMEELLGRYLVDGENVHHKNGVKDDNRPENLELWIRPQPSGMRASDAVAWARDILARYGRCDTGSIVEPPY
jgi:HNH endonuclease